jgi:hypothetical protein
MTVCPVCEHQQELGFECEVCGKDLSGPLAGLGPPPVAIQRVEGLEQTVGERVGDVGVQHINELELNAMPKAPDAPTGGTTDLELSQFAPTGAIPIEKVADLTVDRAPDDGVRTAAPSGQVTCRYCKNISPAGTVCAHCGMRLPRALQTEVSKPKVELFRCIACGAPGPAGAPCKECGRMVTAPEP